MPTKRDRASGVVVDSLPIQRSPAELSAQDVPQPVDDVSRRNFLRRTGSLAGGALATGVSLSQAAPLAIPESNKGFGKPIPEDDYGVPSKFESHVRRRRTDVFKNRQNFSDWSMTPLQHQHGIITPNGLIFERHHDGTPDIDPAKHRLVIHGMVKQPLEFHDGRSAALSVGVEVLFPGVLGKRSDRLAQGRIHHRAADSRALVVRAMDRHPGFLAARRGGT
jgi:hypothetical protein